MRSRETIEKEMFHAREDLERSLAALRHLVVEKVNVRARAHKTLDDAKARARGAVERLRERARRHALLLGVLLGAMVTATVAAAVFMRRRHASRPRRFTSR